MPKPRQSDTPCEGNQTHGLISLTGEINFFKRGFTRVRIKMVVMWGLEFSYHGVRPCIRNSFGQLFACPKIVMLHLRLLWQSLGCFFWRSGSLPAPSATIHPVQRSVLLVCLYVLAFGGSRAAAEPTKVFLENRDAVQSRKAFSPGPPSLRSELKTINPSFLLQCQQMTAGHPVRVVLNLFEGTEYTAALEIKESLAPGRAAL